MADGPADRKGCPLLRYAPVAGSAPLLLRARSLLQGVLRDPLLRNGHALTLSSLASSVVGLAYWGAAAHEYSPTSLGRNSVAISLIMFLAGIAELNLMSALTRFLPVAGRRSVRFVVLVYLTSFSVGLILSGIALLLVRIAVPGLHFLVASPGAAAWFVTSTACWAIFVLQDSVLTGLRRTHLVPLKNATFAVAKVALVVVLAVGWATDGILVSWAIATYAITLPTSLYIFLIALPRHSRAQGDSEQLGLSTLLQYVPADYLGALCWLACTSLLPFAVLARLGARASATFSLCWVISYGLCLVSINMGTSLVVETADNQADLALGIRRLLRHLSMLLGPAALALVLAAPWVLSFFGRSYTSGATTLRLLAVASVPAGISSIAVASCRSLRKVGISAAALVALLAVVALVTWALIGRLGITAVAIAWLLGQVFVAASLMLTSPWWLGSKASAAGRSWRPKLWRWQLGLARVLVGTGFDRAVHSLKQRSGRRVHDRQGALPDVLLKQVSRAMEGRAREPLRLEPMRSDNDVRVFVVRDAAGTALGVLKFARSFLGREDLRRRQRVLSELCSDSRISGWELLPCSPTYEESGDIVWAVEQHLPGKDGAWLLEACPELAPALVARAAEAISAMHTMTSEASQVSSELLDSWVLSSLERLREAAAGVRLGTVHLDAISRVADSLASDLLGRNLPLSWAHGDFTLGNVIFAPGSAVVNGIVDWGRAAPMRLPQVDTLLLAVACESQLRRRGMGTVLAELSDGREGGLSEGWIRPFLAESQLPLRVAASLCWVQHVSSNLEKSERYRNRPLWWAATVEPVLARWSA